MIKLLVAVSGLFAAQPAPGWRITVLDLDVAVTAETHLLQVSGLARLSYTGSGSDRLALLFGPDGMAFDSAAISSPSSVTYSAKRDSLLLRLSAPAASGRELTVRFFGHTNRDIGRNLIRPEGAMVSWGALWYPVLASAADSLLVIEFPGETRITVPAAWRTMSPGSLTDSSVRGSRRTETWRVTRPTARSFVAAPFARSSTTIDGAEVSVYLLPRHASRMREFAAAIPRMVSVLSRYFGPYPFSSFGIVELPREVAPPGFGGRSEPGYFIAHTDALDSALNVSLFAHELTHMWFPNAVDSRPPGDDMMDEAIASYGAAIYKEATLGRDAERRELLEGNPDFSVRAYFNDIRRGTDEPLMADYSPYIARAKGPMVYDMIRRRVGDSVFFGAWRSFASRGRSISLNDFRREIMRRLPSDTGLAGFLSQWLDRKGAPIVEAPRISADRVLIEQRGNLYTLDIPVRIGGRDTTIHLDRRKIEIRAAEAVTLDPNDDVLMWKSKFGPPPDAPASWPLPRFRAWLADEARWLMRSYNVRSAALSVVQNGHVVWTQRYGPDEIQVPGTALTDSLRAHVDSASWRRLVANGDDITLYIGRPAEGGGVWVTTRGGWGGRQMTMHLAQRIAIQYRWKDIPR